MLSSESKPNETKPSWDPKPWRIASAVCVERLPTLTPPLTQLQKDTLKVLGQIEVENSKLSDHEVRHLEDEKAAAKKKTEEKSINVVDTLRTAVDDEEIWAKDAESFKPASTTTEADKSKDLRSSDRELSRPLHLMVKRILGKDQFWDLPTVSHAEGESLRDTAERAISEHCGDNLKVRVLGNAPFTYYKVKFSKKVQEETESRGEKVFVFKAVFDSGKVDLNKELNSDYQWALREDLEEKLTPVTKKTLTPILYDEEP